MTTYDIYIQILISRERKEAEKLFRGRQYVIMLGNLETFDLVPLPASRATFINR